MQDIVLTSDITVRCVQRCGGDHMVVAAARVSTSGEEALKYVDVDPSENAGLIRYLMQHRHGSAFEHSFLTFFVHAPLFVWREWHRHRVGFSYNETSARYKEMEPIFWVPRAERKLVPSPTHKSARPDFVAAGATQQAALQDSLRRAYQSAWDSYQLNLQIGVAREVARVVLPVGIYSSCWVSCNPRSLMHFLSLRTRHEQASYPSYPQAEIEEAALACERVLQEGWPLTWKAWQDCGRVAP